jgi:hypothetical protein
MLENLGYRLGFDPILPASFFNLFQVIYQPAHILPLLFSRLFSGYLNLKFKN